MKRHIAKIALLFLLLALTLMVLPVEAYAANTSNATYLLTIRVTNNGTATAYNVSVPVTLNTTNYVNNDYVWSNLTNTAMITDTGGNGYYNPAVLTNTTWMFFVPSIPGNSVVDYSLYIGGNTPMSGNLSYFAGTAGMTTADNASLELGNNFSITQMGWLDTSNSTAGHNLINKPGAIVANVTAAGNVTLNLAMTKQQTNLAGAALALYSGGSEGFGQRITTMPYGVITSVQFKLAKDGSPTGTGYARVRKGDDFSLIGTIGSLAVSGLDGTATWTTFDTTPVSINETTGRDIVLTMEYAGGSAGNSTLVDYRNSDVMPDESAYRLIGVTWSDYGDRDVGYILDQTITMTGSGLSAGSRAFSIGLVGGNLTMTGATPVAASNYTVTNTATAWSFAQNSTWPYLERQTITVNGTLVQDVGWQNAAIFIDQSGKGNHATPTFRTATTNAAVSAILSNFKAVKQSIISNTTFYSYSTNAVGDMPTMPSEMFGELSPTFPGAKIPDEMAVAGGVPVSLFWFVVPLIIILTIGMVLLKYTQSVFVECIAMGVLTLLVSLIHIWPLWILIPYVMIAGACCLADKVYSY